MDANDDSEPAIRDDIVPLIRASLLATSTELLAQFGAQLDRTGRLIGLGVATVAGMIGIVGLSMQADLSTDGLGFILTGGAAVVAVGAVATFAVAFAGIGTRHEVHLGPDPDDMVLLAGEPRMTPHSFELAMVAQARRAIQRNQQLLARVLYLRTWGLFSLVCSVAVFLLGLAYIVGASILG